MRDFVNSYPKVQIIENQNKFVLRKLVKKYELVLINLLREYQITKGIPTNHFSEWKSHVFSSVNEKISTIKNKITCCSVKSIFSEHEVKKTIFSLKEDFVIVHIDKAAKNVAFICKYFYAVTIIKEQILDCYLSNEEHKNIQKVF